MPEHVFEPGKYDEVLEKLKQVSQTTTVAELEEMLGDSLIVVLGDNCSGVDVVDITGEAFHEWTW